MSDYTEYDLAHAIASFLEGDYYDRSGATYYCKIVDGYQVLVTVITRDDKEMIFGVTVENVED